MNHMKDAFLTLLILFLLYLLTSCKTQYIEVPGDIRTEYINKLRVDSFLIRDSITVRERGDTVYIEKFKLEYINRYRLDTIIQRDSIHIAVPVEKIVYKNKSSNFASILLLLGLLVMLLYRR